MKYAISILLLLSACGKAPTLAVQSASVAPIGPAIKHYDDTIDACNAVQAFAKQKQQFDVLSYGFYSAGIFNLVSGQPVSSISDGVIKLTACTVTIAGGSVSHVDFIIQPGACGGTWQPPCPQNQPYYGPFGAH